LRYNLQPFGAFYSRFAQNPTFPQVIAQNFIKIIFNKVNCGIGAL